jgi:predicted ATPase
LYATLIGQWRYSFVTDKMSAAMQLAKRVYSLAQKQNDPALRIGAYAALAATHCYLGTFETSRQYATRGLRIWGSRGMQSSVEEIITPAVTCLGYKGLCEWHLGEIALSRATTTQAISLAKDLNDMNALAFALYFACGLARFERNPAEVEQLTSHLIELSTRFNFAFWLPGAKVLRGWARSVSGDTVKGISWIEQGIEDYRATGSIAGLPMWLALKAEALHLADRTCEALEAIREAQGLAERFEVRWWYAELHRLRAVFLATLGADKIQIQASFEVAIKIATQQKAISVIKNAEASYAEYRGWKGTAET